MSDSRPRPQYGEYASPEEQEKAIVGGRPAFTPQEPLVPAQVAPAPYVAVAARPRRSDAVVTIVLLFIGLIFVLLAIPGMADLPAAIEQAYALNGYTGHYAPVALGNAIGVAINIVQVGLWCLTFIFSVVAMRRRRLSFYIPIIGAFVCGVVVLILLTVAMVNDPGLVSYMEKLRP